MKKNNNETIKVKKNKIPVWAIVLIVVFGAIPALLYIITFIALGYFAITDNNDNLTKEFEILKINSSYYDIDNKQYVIEGVIKNKTDKDYNDLEIEYYLYDQDGAVITTSKAYIENIKPNEKWHFRAKTEEDIKNVSTFKLNKISGNNFID